MIDTSKFNLKRCDESLEVIRSLMKDLDKKNLAKTCARLKQTRIAVKRHYLVRIQEAIKYGW